ncbi:hypothetical protein KI387_004925, partial [Taxus chinensis]
HHHHSPSPSPRPSSASLRSSRHHRHLHISSDSNSDVAILGPSHDGSTPSAPPAIPLLPLVHLCLFLEGTDTSKKEISPVSSPDTSLVDDILGLAKLYPDSPATEQIETNQPVEDPNTQKVGDILDFTDSEPHANTPKSPSNMDANPTEPVVADSLRDERRVELVSSILNKLQRAFNTLKAWEDFTETTRNAIARDCSELFTLADQLAEDSGSPRARNVVTELKNLI